MNYAKATPSLLTNYLCDKVRSPLSLYVNTALLLPCWPNCQLLIIHNSQNFQSNLGHHL